MEKSAVQPISGNYVLAASSTSFAIHSFSFMSIWKLEAEKTMFAFNVDEFHAINALEGLSG